MPEIRYCDMPKVELHTHLDCAPSFDFVAKFEPGMTFEEYKAKFQAPKKCGDLVEFLKCIDPMIDLLQSSEALTLAAEDIVRQMIADGVVYAEVRFAPHLHTNNGLTTDQAVQSVLNGLRQAEIPVGLILCDLRQFAEEESLETFALVEKYYGAGVVGLDLASDEANFGLENHLKAFRKAQEAGIFRTAHAGEALDFRSVQETIDRLKPNRIGHGVRSINDTGTIAQLCDLDIHLEVCPSVNIQVDVFQTIREHPVDELRRAGVSVGLNTDARATGPSTLTDEYRLVARTFGWKPEDFAQANREAMRHAFCDSKTKDLVLGKLL